MKKLPYLFIVVLACMVCCEEPPGVETNDFDQLLSNDIIPYFKFTYEGTSYSAQANHGWETGGYPIQWRSAGSDFCLDDHVYMKYYTHETGFVIHDTENSDYPDGIWVPDKYFFIGIPLTCGLDETQATFYTILDTGYYDYAVWDSSYHDRRIHALEDDLNNFYVDFAECTYDPVTNWTEQIYSSKWGEQDETCYMKIVEIMKQPPTCNRNYPVHILFKARFSCKLYDEAGEFFQKIKDAEMIGMFTRMNWEPDYPEWNDWLKDCVDYDPVYLYY